MTIPKRAACLERAVALWLLLPPPPPRDDDDSDEANDEVRRGGGDGSAAGRAIAEGPGERVDMLGLCTLCGYGIGSGDSSVIDTRATQLVSRSARSDLKEDAGRVWRSVSPRE